MHLENIKALIKTLIGVITLQISEIFKNLHPFELSFIFWRHSFVDKFYPILFCPSWIYPIRVRLLLRGTALTVLTAAYHRTTIQPTKSNNIYILFYSLSLLFHHILFSASTSSILLCLPACEYFLAMTMSISMITTLFKTPHHPLHLIPYSGFCVKKQFFK